MATIEDVARLAGVNVSTVSRYLSGKLHVQPETERKIRSALQSTHYHPNLLARGLRTGATKSLAAVVPDVYQPGIVAIVAGIERGVKAAGYTLLLSMTGNLVAGEREAVRALAARQVDGIVLVGLPGDAGTKDGALELAATRGIPTVLVSRYFRPSGHIEVCPDQEDGAAQVTAHMIERGRRAIGLVVGTRDHPDSLAKVAGYARAVEEHGVDCREDLVLEGLYDPEATRRATRILLERGADAIICTSDGMAVAALKEVQRVGYSVPEQMSVAGYGGSPETEIVTPTLTTVTVDLEGQGSIAVDLLIRQLGGDSDIPELTVRPVSLKVGQST